MNLKDFKQKKERGLSVKELAQDFLDKAEDYESAFVITLNADNEVKISYSARNTLEMLGMADIAKTMLIEETEV